MSWRSLMFGAAGGLLIQVGTGGAVVAAQAQEQQTLQASFTELLPAIGATTGYDQAQQRWQELCWKAAAPGHEPERLEACRLMTTALGEKQTPAQTKVWFLRQLERIGRGESVAATAKELAATDSQVRESAIRALANNPDPAANVALLSTLKTVPEAAARVPLINALGFRREATSVAELGELLRQPAPVGEAAARALGKIATPEAAQILTQALKASQGEAALQITDALVRCGQRQLAEGKAEPAAQVGQSLIGSPSLPARLAGLELVLQARPELAARTILQVLAAGQPQEATVALGYVSRLNSKSVATLAEGLVSLPEPTKVQLLHALGSRRDGAARGAVVTATKSSDAAVRASALAALGGVGDVSTLPILVEALGQEGDAANAARRSLETTFAGGVDAALVDTMKATADPGRRTQFIEILERRRASLAAPALLEEVLSPEAGVRRRAMAALGNLASEPQIEGMIKGLLKTTDPAERDEARNAITSVCSRIADPARRPEPLLRVYSSASESDKSGLLPLLARLGGPKTLDLVRQGLKSSDADRKAAAQTALWIWPDASISTDILALAEDTSDPELKTRAVQGLCRSLSLAGNLYASEKLAMLIRGMKQANRDEERRLVLDRARDAQTIESVRFVAESLDNPKLTSQACASIVDLLHRPELRDPNQAEANKVLDRVIAITKDKSLAERAKSFQKGN